MRFDARERSRLVTGALVAVLVAAAGSAAIPARADDEDRPPLYEISLGAGGASASESSIFNLPNDTASHPDLLLDFRVRRNVNENFAFGFHMYGTTETTPKFYVTDAFGGVLSVNDYRLTLLHLGADVRWVFSATALQPYVELGASYIAGTLEDDSDQVLRVSGGSVGGGPGVQYVLARHWAVGVQGLFAAGSAKWEKRPFLNSSGRSYEPGFAGAEGFVTWRVFY